MWIGGGASVYEPEPGPVGGSNTSYWPHVDVILVQDRLGLLLYCYDLTCLTPEWLLPTNDTPGSVL